MTDDDSLSSSSHSHPRPLFKCLFRGHQLPGHQRRPHLAVKSSSFLILIILFLNISSSSSSQVKWPKGQDSFDDFLIDLAQSGHLQSGLHRPRRDLEVEDDLPSSPSTAAPPTSGKNTTAKNFTIDWNDVNRRWSATISEDEVTKKFLDMERGMKDGVRNILRTLFPQVVSMSSEAKVSGNCSAGILKWIISLRHLKGWAVKTRLSHSGYVNRNRLHNGLVACPLRESCVLLTKVLDAIGKPGAGLMEGSLTMFGNHRQCLDIRAPDDEDDFDEDSEGEAEGVRKFKEFFRGQYCMLELKPWLPPKPRFYGIEGGRAAIKGLQRPPNDDSVFAEIGNVAQFLHFVAFRIDLCLPSICSREDIQRVANFIASKLDIRARVVRCESRSDSWPDMTPIQILALLGFFGAMGLVGLSTTVVVAWSWFKRGSPPTIFKLLSLTRAWDEFCGLECYLRRPKLPSLYGLRYIVTMWIVFTEIINVIGFCYLREMLPLKDIGISRPAHFITNSSLQYTSFIFISAFLFAYGTEGKGLWASVKYLMRKYFRIVPVVIVGTGMMILLPLLDHKFLKGPVWGDILNNRTEICQTSWWRNVFFIQNFFHPTETCLPETWLLAVELQLVAFFTFLMGFTSSIKDKSRTIQWLILMIIVAVGFAVNFLQVYFYDLPPAWYWTLPDPEQKNEYFQTHLFKPWTHLSTFALGFAAGLISVERKKDSGDDGPYGKMTTRFIGWSFVGILSSVLIFANHDWVLGDLPEPLVAGIYDGVNRIAWSIGHVIMMYFIVSDLDEEGSMSQAILGNKMVVTLGRLSLSAFVVHPIVELLFFATQQTYIFSSPVSIIYFVVGTIAFTYGIALFVTIFFEYPVATIFRTRDSTIVKEDMAAPASKFNKTSTYQVKSNGLDMEMKGNQSRPGDHSVHQIRL